ncbi:MAG TPA: NADH-quinone oxidoreductase subunit NuoH [Gemmataceae bacterium]|nr:NADH-quinone oxidoreductase subunit NuoH [Gemmataceae bacterium]
MPPFNIILTLVTIAAVLFVILNTVALLILAERKVSAYMQDRIGPNRVGPFGILQPFVDGVKMFLKEDIVPSHVDRVFFFLAPGIATGTALLAFAIVPFGNTLPPPGPAATSAEFQQAQENYQRYQFVIAPGIDIGILWVLSISSLTVYGIILGGWSSNNKYSMLGSLRSSAQIISYEIPMGMSILGLVLYSGSLNLEKIIDWQTHHGWNVLYQPLAFIMFMTSVFAECNRLPFDLPEAEQELVGGYHTEYSSIKFAMFMLGEYVHMITTSFLLAILFFGGWQIPGLTDGSEWWHTVLKLVILCGKATIFIMIYMLIRWTLPRFRFDQLMGLAWKVLIPLSVVYLLCVMIVREFGLPLITLTIVSIVLLIVMGYIAATVKAPPVRHVARNVHRPIEVEVS